MKHYDDKELASLGDALKKLNFPLSIANISEEDQPLIYTNKAFSDMTGYGDEVLGENCRFLQKDCENEAAREEIRSAISEKYRTQVVLKNRRHDGSIFYNLLFLEPVGSYRNLPELVLGAQFDLGPENPEDKLFESPSSESKRSFHAFDAATQLRIERRRVMTNSATRLLQAWCTLSDINRAKIVR